MKHQPPTIPRILIVAALMIAVLLLWAPAVTAQEGSAAQGSDGYVSLGKNLFRTYCKSCHGENGKGDGALAASLSTKPSDLTRISVKNNGEFPADKVQATIDGRKKIAGHSADMPRWGEALLNARDGSDEEGVDDQIASIVRYLATIQVTETAGSSE